MLVSVDRSADLAKSSLRSCEEPRAIRPVQRTSIFLDHLLAKAWIKLREAGLSEMFHSLSDTNAYHLLIGRSTTEYEKDPVPLGLRALTVPFLALDCSSIQMITILFSRH